MRIEVTTSCGGAGHFALLHDGIEPLFTGFGRYATADEAVREAVSMSESEGAPLSEATQRRANELGITAKIIPFAKATP